MDYREAVGLAEQHRLYRQVTDLHGPSEALLAFIDPNGQFASQLGMESFDSLSLEERHQIVLDNLDPEYYQSMAMEGLLTKFRKMLGIHFFDDYVGKELVIKPGERHWLTTPAHFHELVRHYAARAAVRKKALESVPPLDSLLRGPPGAIGKLYALLEAAVQKYDAEDPENPRTGSPWTAEQCKSAIAIVTKVDTGAALEVKKLHAKLDPYANVAFGRDSHPELVEKYEKLTAMDDRFPKLVNLMWHLFDNDMHDVAHLSHALTEVLKNFNVVSK